MEFGGQAITPPMELLIYFVVREAGLEIVDPRRGQPNDPPQSAQGSGVADTQDQGRHRARKNPVRRGRH
jgi:hypothetical protein